MSRITDKQLVELINRRNLPPSDPRFISREAMGLLLDGTLEKMVATASVAEASAEPSAPVQEPMLRWRPLHATAIEVNLDAPLILPFPAAVPDWTTPGQTGWVKIELKDGRLFVADREVVLHLTEGQKSGVVNGHSVRQSIQGKLVLHPNILDALYEHQHLIPESWKQNEHGQTLFISFWAVGFRHSGDALCIRRLHCYGPSWSWYYYFLNYSWDASGPAACAS